MSPGDFQRCKVVKGQILTLDIEPEVVKMTSRGHLTTIFQHYPTSKMSFYVYVSCTDELVFYLPP